MVDAGLVFPEKMEETVDHFAEAEAARDKGQKQQEDVKVSAQRPLMESTGGPHRTSSGMT